MSPDSRQRLINILDYWHKIEFFIPFDLDQVSDVEDVWRLRWIKPEQLAQWPAWYFTSQQFDIPAHLKIRGFRLYLGLFDRREIAEVCKTVLPATGDEDENEERGAMEGRTCFARIDLNAYGEPMFDPVSVSTVPWALGRVLAHGIDSLGAGAFEAAKRNLLDRLQDFRTHRARAAAVEPEDPAIAPLSGMEVAALSSLLTEWAGFEPAHGQPILLEVLTAKKESKDKSEPGTPEEEGEAAEPDVEILNSFFIEDIERAMLALREGGEGTAVLATYLTPLAADQRVDLYAGAGRRALLAHLHPTRVNRGRWPSPSSHSMSLMQQFAINTGLADLGDGGLFAVNGPPGTGKTTLLRELFADNIVRRAAVLARLPSAAAALDERVQVGFSDGQPVWIRPLIPELTGFEMVVASSNNAAVENISRDLPKLNSLGKEWQGVDYLRSVAYRIAAEDDDGYFHPSASVAPWGLISCALGNSGNRYRFVSKFYHKNWNEEVEPDSRCQNIRQWIVGYDGPDFQRAADTYRTVAAQAEEALAALASYADLWQQYGVADAARFLRPEQDALASAQALASQAASASVAAGEALQIQLERQADLREEERLLDRERPGWWARLFKPATARRYRDDCAANAGAQRGLLRTVAEAKAAVARSAAAQALAQQAVLTAQTALAQRARLWDASQQQLARYRDRFDCALPASVEDLEQDRFQIAGLWHDDALARLRSQLFVAALALHEAWLAEAGRTGGPGFGGNLLALSKLLTNKLPDHDAHVPLIWQSLFMAVPVVSTTFASLARQFRGMGAGSIGWLFIDEAGQAVPQAAVGGLLRARRAVVVGDPLQIEPVFTVPLALIRALSAQSHDTADEAYAPDKVSVQRLADSANRYGTLVPQPGGDGLWIGSPLRVHRRCADPMFSLANSIAYDGKMVIEAARRVPMPLRVPMGDSAWIDIGGAVARKQVVPAQIDFAAQVVAALYRRGGALPELYVISPFKAVRDALRKRIGEIAWPGKPPSKSAVTEWCKASVGTVHTFQGKEQAAVLMVLGVDADSAGSAAWAAAKPNLLNVALTRAQQQFYIVGAGEVWRGQPYFGAAYATLRKRSAADFLAGI